MDDGRLDSLLAALAGRPDDLPLPLHVADQLLAADRHAEAVGIVAPALAAEPADPRIQGLMQRAPAGPGSVRGVADPGRRVAAGPGQPLIRAQPSMWG